MGLKGKIFKFMSDTLKDGSYYKLYTQANSTSACGLPKGFFLYTFAQEYLIGRKATVPGQKIHSFIHLIIQSSHDYHAFHGMYFRYYAS